MNRLDMSANNPAVRRLLPFALRDTRAEDGSDGSPLVSAFVARKLEHFAELRLPVDGLIVILEGTKEVQRGAERHVFAPGTAFVAPAEVAMDVTNLPDETSGHYRALFLRLPRMLIVEAARRWPQFVGPSPIEARPLLLDAVLGEALAHILADDEGAHSPTLVQHRLLEIVLILAERGALALTPKYAEQPLADALRRLFQHRLHHRWTTAGAARQLGLSEATLRRRLRTEGNGFARLLLTERMAAAHILLTQRGAEVADTIAATGFASRAHFAEQYRRSYGMSPSDARRRARHMPEPGGSDRVHS